VHKPKRATNAYFRQFDRLAIMYLGDIEVWRTSTAEPTSNGIVFNYVKEMQQYNALWKQPQKIIFDLGNLVDNTYTGVWHTTLTATFFTVPDSPATADSILPISKRASASNAASVFSIPADDASVAYTLPRNIDRAVVSLSACGQGGEEFWYTNTLSSETDTFASTAGSLYGGSPWREVQILIDGQLAGVSWPFPIIFTGGIVPGFWRPIVGIDAYDLREHEVDITPFVPYLSDGKSHTFEIRVASLDDDDAGNPTLLDTVGDNWLVTGKIFLFSGSKNKVTTGSAPTISAPAPQFSISSSITQDGNGTNQTLTYTTTAKRELSVSATVNSKKVSWVQSLTYTNFNELSNYGVTQYTKQNTIGADQNPRLGYFSAYSYPITVNSTYEAIPNGPTSINGTLDRSLNIGTVGPSVFPSGVQPFNTTTNSVPPQKFSLTPLQSPKQISLPASLPKFSGSVLNTTQTGTAVYYNSGAANGSYSTGATAQVFSFKGLELGGGGLTTELYSRDVEAVNTTIVKDDEFLLGKKYGLSIGVPRPVGAQQVLSVGSVKAALGRGPGKSKEQLADGGR
jgi:hypothetical protein